MNGEVGALPKFSMPPIGNPEVIRVLEGLLAEARAGRLIGVGVVAVGDGGQMRAMTTGSAPLPVIYTGAGLLQQQAMQSMMGKPSSILQVR